MRALLAALLISAATAFAGDLTGKWTGSAEYEDGGELRKVQISAELKQSSSEVTGDVLGPAGERWSVKNGRIDGGRLTFELTHETGPIKFDLAVAGERLTGDGTLDHESGSRVPIKVALERAKPANSGT